MILPSKNIAPDRALLTLAGKVFACLKAPSTVSRLWDDIRADHQARPISYGWFVLAVDLLFILNLVEFDQKGLLHRSAERS
jgi:hypothetical protein